MIIAKYIILNQNSLPININGILGGSHTYERIVISPIGIGEDHKHRGVGENLGAVYVGDLNVNGSTFDDIVLTGDSRGYDTTDYSNLGTDMFVFVPQVESIKVGVLGFVP
jgi:hypothetical protein